jgi:hypothetical protein
MKSAGFRRLLATFAVSIFLMAGSLSDVYGYGGPEPPPGGFSLRGPAVLATVTLNGRSIAVSNVICKGKEQTSPASSPFTYNLNDITSAQDVVGFYIEGGTASLPDCYDFTGGLIVQAAHSLKVIPMDDGYMYQIDVVVMGVVAK